jgi:hypothetical protein
MGMVPNFFAAACGAERRGLYLILPSGSAGLGGDGTGAAASSLAVRGFPCAAGAGWMWQTPFLTCIWVGWSHVHIHLAHPTFPV